MSSFADFTPKIRDTMQLGVKLLKEAKTLATSRNKMEDYFNITNTTGKEWEAFKTFSKKVTNLCDDAIHLAGREEDKIHIAFIGTINAGKTTLINRLLQEDVLPVMNGETTFCSVAISGTSDKKITATERKSGKTLQVDNLMGLLDVLKAKPERERLGIEPNSVIDVQSPKEGCKALVEHVVLYDTPGIGHRPQTDDAVVDLCKNVDVVVAVMDIHSPSLRVILDVVKKVRCNFTYGVFTRWDSFKGENADAAEERKKDYTTDFRNAVPKRGDVFFIDSKSVKDKKISDGSDGFGDLERKLQEASKGALKLDTLKFQLQKILKEAKSVPKELMDVIETRKNKLISDITRKLETVHDFQKTYKNHFDSMGEAVRGIVDKETKRVQDGDFDENIKCEMAKKGLREETLEKCRKRLNSEFQAEVEKNPQIKEDLRAISKSFKEMEPELSDKFSVPVVTSPWKEGDFELDNDFTFNDNNLHSYLTKPGWLLKGIGYGTLAAVGSAAMFEALPLSAVFATVSAFGGPTVNVLLPITDPCGWVKFFWPTSHEEIKAVQGFFRTKTAKVQQEKVASLIKEIQELQNQADNKVNAEMKSLNEEIESLKTGEGFLNKQLSDTIALKKSFEELEQEVKVITLET